LAVFNVNYKDWIQRALLFGSAKYGRL